jgi:hypothetical protein
MMPIETISRSAPIRVRPVQIRPPARRGGHRGPQPSRPIAAPPRYRGTLHAGPEKAVVQMPDRLAVVRVEPGETLQRLAARVAPDAPTGQVAARIRELNELDSSAVTAGQTLIAPVG